MWNDLFENNFLKLKDKVAEADTLLLPNFSKPFAIFCDASDKAIGFYLAQEENKHLWPVFYNGRTLLIMSGGIAQLTKNCCLFITQLSVVIFTYLEIV